MLETLAYTVIIIVVAGLLLWVFILLPYDMAKVRRRSGIFWVLISLILSPLLAIFLLWVLGDKR